MSVLDTNRTPCLAKTLTRDCWLWLLLAVLGCVLHSSSPAWALPSVPGLTVEVYAELSGPNEMSFDAAGNLYVGSGASVDFIRRIGPGGSPVLPYGNVGIADPDSVLVDSAGAISGTPGSVLVGGESASAKISAILPDESVITVFNLPALSNPLGMTFDSTGRLVFGAGFPNGNVWVSSGAQPTVLFSAIPVIQSLEVGPMDRIYTTNNTGSMQIHDAAGAVVDASFVTGLGASTQIEFGPGGPWGTDLYALSNGELLRIDDLGASVVVGTGFETVVASLEFGPDGALYISDFFGDQVLRITPEPSTLVLAVVMIALLFAQRRSWFWQRITRKEPVMNFHLVNTFALLVLFFAAPSVSADTIVQPGDNDGYVLADPFFIFQPEPIARVGSSTGPGGVPLQTNVMMVFEVPVLPAGHVVTDADLLFPIDHRDGVPPNNGDLWGIGFQGTSDAILEFLKTDGPDVAGNVKLQDNILTPSTVGGFVNTDATGDAALATYMQSFYSSNAGYSGGSYVFFRLNGDADAPQSPPHGIGYEVGLPLGGYRLDLTLQTEFVPEPSSVMLLSIAALGLAGYGRGKRRN